MQRTIRPFSQAAIYSRSLYINVARANIRKGAIVLSFAESAIHADSSRRQAGFAGGGERWRRSCEKETNQPFTVTPVNTHISSKGCSVVSNRRSSLFSIRLFLSFLPPPPLISSRLRSPFLFSCTPPSFSILSPSVPRRLFQPLARSHSH